MARPKRNMGRSHDDGTVKRRRLASPASHASSSAAFPASHPSTSAPPPPLQVQHAGPSSASILHITPSIRSGYSSTLGHSSSSTSHNPFHSSSALPATAPPYSRSPRAPPSLITKRESLTELVTLPPITLSATSTDFPSTAPVRSPLYPQLSHAGTRHSHGTVTHSSPRTFSRELAAPPRGLKSPTQPESPRPRRDSRHWFNPSTVPMEAHATSRTLSSPYGSLPPPLASPIETNPNGVAVSVPPGRFKSPPQGYPWQPYPEMNSGYVQKQEEASPPGRLPGYSPQYPPSPGHARHRSSQDSWGEPSQHAHELHRPPSQGYGGQNFIPVDGTQTPIPPPSGRRPEEAVPVQQPPQYSMPLSAGLVTGVPPPGHSHVMSGTPAMAYAGPQMYSDPALVVSLAAKHPRKNHRATMACNHCRARKQKCDEKSPCSWCRQENVECTYRDPPPSKTDKNMTQVLDMLGSMAREIESLSSGMGRVQADVNELKGKKPKGAKRSRTSGEFKEEDSEPADSPTSPSSPASPALQRSPRVEPTREVIMADALQSGESPELHSTGAHNLFEWPKINKFYQAANIKDKNYLDELEKVQGVLRLYSSGNSGDRGVMAPPSSSGTTAATYPSPSDDADFGSGWDHGKDFRYPYHNIGGLNSDGTLRLDKDTVMKLVDSYMINMWIIFPIIPLERLKSRIETFIQMYSPPDDVLMMDTHTPPAAQAHDSPYHGLPAKRSHPESSDREDTSRRGYAPPPKKMPDSSVNNAIILLVLALGKLCNYDRFLKVDHTWYGDGHRNSPMDQMSTPSPGHSIGRPTSMSRSSSQDPLWRDLKEQPLNVNVYPGLAYYTIASEILGSLTGGRDVHYVHAYILAALYMGQIGRVYSAYEWVSRAANIMVELRRKHEDTLLQQGPNDSITDLAQYPTETQDLTETLALTFWTIHQMEGDIRAELDHLPQSGLASLVHGPNDSNVRFPIRLPSIKDEATPIALFKTTLDVQNVLFHFNAQLYIRKILNRIHATLYGEHSSRISPTEVVELWKQVERWRPIQSLSPFWQDEDPPAKNVLDARLRGKYYGAVYVVNRPWLQSVLDPSSMGHGAAERKLQIADYDEILKSGFGGGDDSLLMAMGDVSNDFARAVGCRRCILAALHSTVAFDGLLIQDDGRIGVRPKLTNIQGTLAAQFSNMLVVSNAYLEPVLRPLVPENLFFPYLQRTIDLLHNLSPVSLIFKKHCEVLLCAQKEVEVQYRVTHNNQNPPRYSTKAQLQAAVVAALHGVGNVSSSGSSVAGSGRGRALSGSGSQAGSQRDESHPSTPTYHSSSARPGSVHSSFGARSTN